MWRGAQRAPKKIRDLQQRGQLVYAFLLKEYATMSQQTRGMETTLLPLVDSPIQILERSAIAINTVTYVQGQDLAFDRMSNYCC